MRHLSATQFVGKFEGQIWNMGGAFSRMLVLRLLLLKLRKDVNDRMTASQVVAMADEDVRVGRWLHNLQEAMNAICMHPENDMLWVGLQAIQMLFPPQSVRRKGVLFANPTDVQEDDVAAMGD